MSILTIGAGPTGLGVGLRLSSTNISCRIFEKNFIAGGLSSSTKDVHQFTWDIGGHVLFSHYPEFDIAVENALQGKYYQHQRESWVRIYNTWIPYPFQNNVRHLPEEARNFCVQGLQNLPTNPSQTSHFKDWMNAVFGEGIVYYFMAPYNFKVWATPLDQMSKDWIAERVSIVDLARIERNIAEQRDDVGWGPNNLFKFPKQGGTGAIYEGIAKQFKDKISFNHELTAVDLNRKEIAFANGHQATYDSLISTIPLDQLIKCCTSVPSNVREAAKTLKHNSVFVVGLGFRGQREDTKCWMYFPEANCPFYRVTNFHNYSPYNVPNGDIKNYFSLMCETSYSEHKPVSKKGIIEETIQGLINTGMLKEKERNNIISRQLIDVPYAYPIPTLDRDAALDIIQPFLESHGVYSRGRFGSWKYEVGNMDHSFMQGVEVVDRIINGTKEKVYHGQ